jgi:hypothetical protein
MDFYDDGLALTYDWADEVHTGGEAPICLIFSVDTGAGGPVAAAPASAAREDGWRRAIQIGWYAAGASF